MNQFTQFDREVYFSKKMRDLQIPFFEGDTNPASRREAFRCAIIDAGLESKPLGRNKAGVVESYADFFAETYQQPLYRETA